MNEYVTGTIIKELREKYRLTQSELADKINVSTNMMRSLFYVCPICGNIFHGMGEAVVQCHGIVLTPCQAEETDERHMIFIERVEDEYFVCIDHEMTKQHYVSFIAALSSDKLQMIKLYPEGNAEARFKISGVKRIIFYCNQDGLFSINIVKGIDDKSTSYDDIQERKELEYVAKMLFG